jgi:transcription elongation factor GreA
MDVEELLKLARKGKLDELESAWMAAVGEGTLDVESAIAVLEMLASKEQFETAESLLWFLLDALRDEGQAERALEVARQAARLLPASQMLRESLSALYRQSGGPERDIAGLVNATLGDAAVPLDHAVCSLDRVLSLQGGTYVLDPQHGTVGRVAAVDAKEGRLLVDFGDGQKAYAPALAERLEPVGPDDFRALSAFERDRIVALAEENPEELVRIVLATLDRRMELRRLRLYLEPIVGSWSKWWSRAREAIKRSSVIGMTQGSQPSLFLRAQAVSHGDRVLQQVRSAASAAEKLALALDAIRDQRGATALEAATLQAMLDEVAGVAEAGAGNPVLQLAAAAVADAYGKRFPTLAIPAGLLSPPVAQALADPEMLPAAPLGDRVLMRTLGFIRERATTLWPGYFVAVMPLCGREACEAIARHLAEGGPAGALAAACQEILARPDGNPDALAWLWREATGPTAGRDLGELDTAALALEILSAGAAVVRVQELRDEERKRQIGELRSALFVRDGGALRKALEGARPDQVTAIKALGESNAALTVHMQASLLSMLRAIEPSLFQKAVPPWEENVIYATQEGIERRKAEVRHITHERLPQVIREIGQAAAFGDVSDNAEYTAAVQERARLAQRAAHMQEEIAGARLIAPQMAQQDHVTIGSRVLARNLATGQVETFVFLGPWDARPEQNVCAYNAALGLAFMGKRVGDTAALRLEGEERRWEIVETGPAL